MSIVLVHIGSMLPPYIGDTVAQIRSFYTGDIFLLRSPLSEDNKVDQSVTQIDISRYSNDSPWMSFMKRDFFKEGSNASFWSRTFKRLFVLESFMKEHKKPIIHMENDVLIYADPSKLLETLERTYGDSVALNPVGPDHVSFAFTYVGSFDALSGLNRTLLGLLEKGERWLLANVCPMGVSEMTLANHAVKQGLSEVGQLPNLPPTEGGFLFDGASWGQYIGGTPDICGGDKPGVFFEHHWVGRELKKGFYTVIWEQDSQGRKVPIVQDTRDGSKHRLANAHIHCKKLNLYR